MIDSEDFADWYDYLELFTYGEITDKEVKDAFKTILQWKNDRVFISDVIPDGKYTVMEYWLFLSLMGECIEYGCSPRGAWLTEFGEDVLEYLNKEISDERCE